jgi:hypothetical protein
MAASLKLAAAPAAAPTAAPTAAPAASTQDTKFCIAQAPDDRGPDPDYRDPYADQSDDQATTSDLSDDSYGSLGWRFHI